MISPLSLVELYAVLSRLKPHLHLPSGMREVPLDLLVEFIVEDCKLKIAYALKLALMEAGGWKSRVPLEYLYALRLAERLKLRTLDLLHVILATLTRDLVDSFVTGDHEILERRREIRELLGLEIVAPGELI